MFDDVIVVYKFIGDLMFFVTGLTGRERAHLVPGAAGLL